MTSKRWLVYPHDAGQIEHLERLLGVSPILAQLLIRRGLQHPDEASRFLDPRLSDLRDPKLLPGVPRAVDVISAAIEQGQKIAVYGDYDADGMTATAILVGCLERLGATVTYFVPNRLDDGYGLNIESLEHLASLGVQVLVSVDCGISSVECGRRARELGLPLVITDHHRPGAELPDAEAIVHPALPGSAYPFRDLCGAAVALKLAWALCQRACQSERVTPELRDFLMQSLGLAAIGTVCDVVPLIDENRVIVRHGLLALRSHPQLGIQALAAAAARGEKDAALSSEDIAFSLGPRLNAAGRLGQAQLGVELLTTSSVPRAAALAEYLHALNDSRDSLDRRIFLSANKQIEERFSADESAIVLADADWHAGIIGIVAGRIAEKRHRPTLLISLDPMQTRSGMGSGRSAGGLDLHQALQACREHLLSFGGHAAAAGFRIAAENIDAFRAAFLEYVETHQSPEERVAELQVDAEAFLSQLTLDAVIDLERLAPFGQANPRPLLAATNVQLADAPRYLGNGQRHLAVQLAQHEKRLRAVAFGRGDWLEALAAASNGVDIVFRPVINAFRGRRSVELHLVDWRPAAVGSAAASSGGGP